MKVGEGLVVYWANSWCDYQAMLRIFSGREVETSKRLYRLVP
jgi:hypothetical protein